MSATVHTSSERVSRNGSESVHYVVWKSMPGGMESFITAYVEHFNRSRECFLFSLRPSSNGLCDKVAGFDQGSEDNLSLYLSYFRYCRVHRKDLFHLLNGGPFVLLITLLAGVKRPVYHIHGTKYWRTWKDKWFMRSAWLLTRLFKVRYVANSHHSAVQFQRRAAPTAPMVVYNGFGTGPLVAKRRRRTALERMAYVGRIVKGKNVHLVLAMFNAIADDRKELELHFVGTGDLEMAMRDEALKSSARRRIFFHGWVEDVPAQLAAMDLVVFPSSYESFGNVLAECLLNGLPVLTSDLPVFEEIHGDKATFCIGTTEEPNGSVERFRQAVQDFDHLAERAYAISDRIAERFNMTVHLNAIEAIYAQR